ncbi:MAG: CopG family antitoxin [Calditrichaceae bacterium]
MKDIKLDSFEKEIENDAEEYVKASKKTRQRVTKIISKANEKNRVTLRLSNQTLESIKRKAQEEGLPYQTFISSILYKYATDQLMDEKHILKSLRLLKKQTVV